MVMSAPLRNPLDRWAHLTPSSDMAAPVSSPLRSWDPVWVPYAAHMEEAALPRVDEIVAAARALVAPR